MINILRDASRESIRTLEQDKDNLSRIIRDIGLAKRTLREDNGKLQTVVAKLHEELRLIKLRAAVAAGSPKLVDFGGRAEPAASATEAAGSPTSRGQAQPPASATPAEASPIDVTHEIKGDGELDTSSDVKPISGDVPPTLMVDDALTLDALAAAVRLEPGVGTPKFRLSCKTPVSAYTGASSSSSVPPPTKKVKVEPASGVPRKGS